MDLFKKVHACIAVVRLNDKPSGLCMFCGRTLSGKPANPSMSDSVADQHHDLMICSCPPSIGIEACIFYLC